VPASATNASNSNETNDDTISYDEYVYLIYQVYLLKLLGPMGQSQMPPASPFQRSSSAASNSCPSPYNQAPNPQYSQMYQPGVRMPQTYSNTTNVMQQQYPNYPGGTPQWAGQNVSTNQHYMVPPQQRMPYNTGMSRFY
jgi:hypothetical protein